MIKGFLLDIDGTLLLSNDAHASAWIDAFNAFGYRVSFQEIRPLIGMGSDHVLPILFPKLSQDHGIGREIIEKRSKLFKQNYLAGLTPTNGARELIKELVNRHFKLTVATSSSKNELHGLLQKAKVDDLLTSFTTASDVKSSKPSPDIIEAALKKIGLNNNEVYLIGDTPFDIQAAAKSNVKTIAFRCGGFSDELLRLANFIFDDPFELSKQLDKVI